MSEYVLELREAKPCPFCGHSPTIQPWHGGGPKKRMIACVNDECPACPMVAGSTRQRALDRWNQRLVSSKVTIGVLDTVHYWSPRPSNRPDWP